MPKEKKHQTKRRTVAIRQPELKQACIEWFDDFITFATEKLPEVQYIDGLLAGFLTSYVIDLHATELLPKLKAMYMIQDV